MNVEGLHHVSLAVTDLERSRRFYSDILGLEEMERPPFDFAGIWYRVGSCQLHLIAHKSPTLRKSGIDSRDVHFAIRVPSYAAAVRALRARGYCQEAVEEIKRVREQRGGAAGFPQVFLLDPDGHVIELNARLLDD